MTEQQNQRRKQSHWALMAAAITLLLFLAALYGSEIHFGLIWDDPEWFGRVVGKSFWQLLQPSADFHFFRPGVMVYNRLFVKHDETLAVETLHWVQICWHLLNLALIFALSRRLGFRRWAAFTVIVLAGLHPFVYQSVAWAAPGQPLTAVLLNSAWVLYLMARSAAAHSRPRQLLLISVLSFITALSISEGAVPWPPCPFCLNWRCAKSIPVECPFNQRVASPPAKQAAVAAFISGGGHPVHRLLAAGSQRKRHHQPDV
ncbi:MAG: hypothetical protein M5U34_49105 [Chloroflexi bacterium]|nr:hypothetical protein [Chloroflexota bacterium]